MVLIDDEEQRVSGIRAEQVILAVPQFVAGRIVRPWREQPPGHLAAFEYGSWLVANLHLHGRPREEGVPLAWDNVPYESPSLGYVRCHAPAWPRLRTHDFHATTILSALPTAAPSGANCSA